MFPLIAFGNPLFIKSAKAKGLEVTCCGAVFNASGPLSFLILGLATLFELPRVPFIFFTGLPGTLYRISSLLDFIAFCT